MNLWFSLSTITVTAKVAAEAWDKVKRIAAGRYKIADVVSAMIMMADEAVLKERLDKHLVEVEQLPKSVQNVLRDQDKLTPEQRKIIIDSL